MDTLTGEANYDIDQEDIRANEPSLFASMNTPKKTQLFEQQFETDLLAGHLPDTGAIYSYVLEQGFLMKHAHRHPFADHDQVKLLVSVVVHPQRRRHHACIGKTRRKRLGDIGEAAASIVLQQMTVWCDAVLPGNDACAS